MHIIRIRVQNDKPTVLVHDNDIESAIKLLRKRVECAKVFQQIRGPRKSVTAQQRKLKRRLRAFEDKKGQRNER